MTDMTTTPDRLKLARDALKPCPFCGNRSSLTVRPDNAEATIYFAAVACFCGGYSACAHKMATAPEAAEAEALARAAWNRRAAIDALPDSVPSGEPAERTLLKQYDREQLPGYRAGYEDGRQRGYAVGHRHGTEQAAAHATAQAAPAPAPTEVAGYVESLAHRIAWRYKQSIDPAHSDTYTFNRATLLQFADALAARTQAPAAPAVAAPDPQGWRPIETAPTDGTLVLLAGCRKQVVAAWVEHEIEWWHIDDNKHGPFPLRGPAPTHWMPLPAAPTTQEPQ